MSGRAVPRVARWLVSHLIAAEDREFLLSDLEEGYERCVERRDAGAARRWYWWQVVRALPRLVVARCASASVVTRGGVASGASRGVRLFRRRPLYALGVVITLGSGLGSAGAVLAVARSVWFRPLGHAGSERIVRIYEVNLGDANADGDAARRSRLLAEPSRRSALSPPFAEDVQQGNWTSLESVAAMSMNSYDWTGTDAARRLSALQATRTAFDVLGVRLILGRAFGRDDPDEVVLTERFWSSAFGSDPRVLDRSMVLDGVARRIVGVVRVPNGYPARSDVWAPLRFEGESLTEGSRGARYLDMAGRLRSGRTPAEAAAELDAFVSGLGVVHPNERNWGATAVSLRTDLIRPYTGVLTALLAAGVAFLVLAGVNVAGLVAARRAEERVERSIRVALGASRAGVAAEGVFEVLLLSLCGAIVALAAAPAVLASLSSLAPVGIPRLEEVHIDGVVVLSILAAGLACGLLAGIVGHAMSGVRTEIAVGRSPAVPGVRGRRLLLVTQLALSAWLLVTSTALMRRISVLRSADPGFRPEHVLTTPLSLNSTRYTSRAQRASFWNALVTRLDSRGMRVAVGTNAPVSGSTMHFGFHVDGVDGMQFGEYHSISPSYFDVLGIATISGRLFTTTLDRAESAPVVIVSENLARRFFPGGDAVGRDIDLVGVKRSIVGVVGSTRHSGPDESPPLEVYVPISQEAWAFGNLLVRGDDAAEYQAAVQMIVAELDPLVPVPPLAPFVDYIRTWFAPIRFQLIVLTLLAGVGTGLAALGVHALVAYYVTSRRREMGIRMALGQRREAIAGVVIGQATALAAVGAVAGLMASIATRTLASRLIADIDAADPIVLMGVGTILVGAAVTAAVWPALRAARSDPLIALRSD